MLRLLAASAAALAAWPGSAATCSWTSILADTDLGLSDRHATYLWYWSRVVPGENITVAGDFPHSRYLSIVLQDQAGKVIDSLDDVDIRPTAGINPFRSGAARSQTGRYRVRISPDAPPPRRAANTLYAGQALDGSPNELLLVNVRNYLTDRRHAKAAGGPLWQTGGVPPPAITHEVNGRPVPCPDAEAARSAWRARQPTTEEQTRGVTAVPGQRQAASPPRWTHSSRLDLRRSNLLGPNDSTTYLSTPVSAANGPLLVLRWRPPATPVETYEGARFGRPVDMRYWSVSFMHRPPGAEGFGGIRTVATRADLEVPRLADGTVQLVVGFAGVERPPMVPVEQWVGLPFADGTVMVREIRTEPTYRLDQGARPRGPVLPGEDAATPGGVYATPEALAADPDIGLRRRELLSENAAAAAAPKP